MFVSIGLKLYIDRKTKIIFTANDITEEGEADIGLLECFREQKIGKKPNIYYSFNHLLIQEFLTAVHVCINKESISPLSQTVTQSQRLDNVHLSWLDFWVMRIWDVNS